MSDDTTDGLRWEIRRSLIERLRIPWEGMGEMANQQREEAAVQISTMMDEIEAWRQAMQKAERDIAELRDALEIEKDAVNHLHTDRNNLRLEVERLRKERNAFEEERDELIRISNKLKHERDEARREVCLTWESVMGREAQTVAEDKGWDCFKENTND